MTYATMVAPFILLLILAILFTPIATDPTYCPDVGNTFSTTNNTSYQTSLDSVLSSLATNINSTGFYSASAGLNESNTVHAIALCRGDLTVDSCRSCVQEGVTNLSNSCPFRKQAILWMEQCMLRYSNETISWAGTADPPKYLLGNPENARNADMFNQDLRNLVQKLREKAVSGGAMRKVAAGVTRDIDSETIFALAQCTPDLSPEICSNCLRDVAQEIPFCCGGKRGERVLYAGCNLRFETYSFFNETGFQEFLIVPVENQQPTGSNNGNKSQTTIIVVISIVVCFIVVGGGAIFLFKKKKKQKLMKRLQNDNNESLQYAFHAIRSATNDFSDNYKLGKGGFGAVYKGKLSNGQEIAVKRLSRDSKQGAFEFKNEVQLLARLQHKNLVRLLGYAVEGMEKLLVYEYLPNASLDFIIFDSDKCSYLDWDKRYNIIKDIAKGMLYLHEDSPLRIIHRDLKASNILLDEEMNPKIADFGMARLFGQHEIEEKTSRIVGTYGYMAPEYAMHGQISVKSDVFSFGVLVLEIISGQRSNHQFRSGDTSMDLLSFAWKNWHDDSFTNIVDPCLVRSNLNSMEDIQRCIHIGLLCVQENAVDRPIMASVILMLGRLSITLAVPSEPPFCLRSSYDSYVSSKNDSTLSKSYKPDGSINGVSITELYPR